MSDIELRWAVPASTSAPVLQWRTRIETDERGFIIPRPYWSAWTDVPKVVLASKPDHGQEAKS